MDEALVVRMALPFSIAQYASQLVDSLASTGGPLPSGEARGPNQVCVAVGAALGKEGPEIRYCAWRDWPRGRGPRRT